MAIQIVDVNAGAIAGLWLLRYVSNNWTMSPHGRVEAVSCPLESLSPMLADKFQDGEDWRTMGLDVISLEHLLCKFAQAIKRKLL